MCHKMCGREEKLNEGAKNEERKPLSLIMGSHSGSS
jgi:hypothetical protein